MILVTTLIAANVMASLLLINSLIQWKQLKSK